MAEAPIMFERDGTYFLLTSGATGWSPNQQMYATAPSIDGPWTQPSPVSFASQSAYETQGAHAIAIEGTEHTSYLYLADRWAGSFMPTPSVMESRYVWLPLSFPTPTSVDMEWADRVTIDTETGELEGEVSEPPQGRRLAVEEIDVGSTSNATQPPHHPFVHSARHNSAANMLDGRHETAWISANAEPAGDPDTSWAQLDLGEQTALDTVRLMLFRGGVRTHPLEISVADDGDDPGDPASFATAFEDETEMRTGFQDFELEPGTEGRYVRVAVTGPGEGDRSNSDRMVPRNSFGIVEAELYDTGVTRETCAPLRSDEFAGAALDSARWDFVHPTTPASGPDAPAIAGGELLLPTLPGEIDDGGPVSFVGQELPAGEHWSVTAKLTLGHTDGWQQAGLVLYADDDDFIRLSFTRDDDGGNAGQRFFEVVSVRGGERQQGPQTAISADHTDTVLVRLTRVGDEIVPRFSTGGGAFFTAQGGIWFSQDSGAQSSFHGGAELDAAGLTGPAARVGPYAGGGGDGPHPQAAFDWVRVGPESYDCEAAVADLRPRSQPPIRRVGAKRKQAAFRFRVQNAGNIASGPVELCAAAPKRRLRILGPRCRSFADVAPGVARVRALRARIKQPARGKTTAIRLVARGPGVDPARTTARVRVRGQR